MLYLTHGGALYVGSPDPDESADSLAQRMWFVLKANSRGIRPASDRDGDGEDRDRSSIQSLNRLVHLSRAWCSNRNLGCTYAPAIQREIEELGAGKK